MIYRLHYRRLNNYLAFYFQKRQRQLSDKSKVILIEKAESFEITKLKAKLIGAMA